MNDFRVTPEQQAAIHCAKNVAITAGAGTGKTEVMIRRIINALEDAERIDELLVVTFTEKAAAEIRERAYRAILRRIAETSGDRRARFLRMRDTFAKNRMSTMHAFFAQIVRAFTDDSDGARPDYGILDASEKSILLWEIVAARLDEIATGPDSPPKQDLRVWIRAGTSREGVAVGVCELIEQRTMTLPWLRRAAAAEPEMWLRAVRERALDLTRAQGEAFLTRPDIASLLGAIASYAPRSPNAVDRLTELQALVVRAMTTRSLHELHASLVTTQGARSTTTLGNQKTWEPATLAALRSDLGEIAAAVAATPELGFVWDEDTEELAAALSGSIARLALACLATYEEEKTSRNVLDYADLELRAEALLNRTDVMTALRERFRSISIDEFQDTSLRHWALFRSLASGVDGSLVPGKLFIVGDEKQAIYSFRGGNAEVCQQARDEIGRSLVFTGNFRSKANLVLFTNRFFSRLLVGGSPYEATAQDLHLADEPGPPQDSRPDAGSVRHLVVVGDHGLADALATEAHALAAFLRDLMDEVYEDEYPGIAARMRAGERTVGMLFRRASHQAVYEQALREHGVPFSTAKGSGFFSRGEILDLRNALRAIARGHDDIALMGLLRSPLIGCSDAGLLLLAARRMRDMSVAMALDGSESVDGFIECGMSATDAAALIKAKHLLVRWRKCAQSENTARLLLRVLRESGAYAPLAMGTDGRQRIANVEKFVDFAQSFDARHGTTLTDFISEVDKKAERDEETDADVPDTGAVQLLTAHRAKGLQWPIVIVPDTNWAPSRGIESRGPDGLGMSRVGMATVSGRTGPATEIVVKPRARSGADAIPFMWQVAELEARQRNAAELKRLLYVAFTRAESHLIFCTPDGNPARGSWAAMIDEVLTDSEVTQGSHAFFRRLEIAQRPVPRAKPTPVRRSGLDLSRIPPIVWQQERTGLELVESLEAVLADVGRQLLAACLREGIEPDAIARHARHWLTRSEASLDAVTVYGLVSAVSHARSWFVERFGPLEHVRWLPAFSNGGRYDQALALVRRESSRWTLVDVLFRWTRLGGAAPDPVAEVRRRDLLRVAREVMGDAEATTAVFDRHGIAALADGDEPAGRQLAFF